MRGGVLDGLGPSGLAAVLSALVFESRRPDDLRGRESPAAPTQRAIDDLERLWRELDAVERAHRLDFLRQPDVGFAWAAYRWAEGDELDDVLGRATWLPATSCAG